MTLKEFKLPDIGEGVVEGEIVSWKVAAGQAVNEEDEFVEVMTDKATVTITVPFTGSIAELRCKEGDVVPVGSVIAVIDATGATSIVERCLPLTKIGGTFLVYGMSDEGATVPFSPYDIFRRELTIKGSFAQTHCFDRALAYLRSGRVQTEGIITHTFGLDDFETALDALRNDPECLKAAIVP